MNDLQKHFLAESINKLTVLRKNLNEDFSENRRREAFRTIHTVKGASQTFGLANTAKLAGNLENLLANRENFAGENFKPLLLEGIELLTASLNQENPDSEASFIEKLQTENQTSAPKSNILLTPIPPDIFKNFSEAEKSAVLAALRHGKNILCAEVGFEAANFADEYRNLRKVLSEKGEVIAALPSAKFDNLGKIGFQIFLASDLAAEILQETIESFSATVVSHTCSENSSGDLHEMFSQIAAHGENLAKNLGKEVDISVLASDTKLSAETSKAFFDILLHLVRNAVDHAIAGKGKIEICLFDVDKEFHLTVADDGKGVDLAKVRTRAIAKNLISADDVLNEQQTLELIFASELSTADAPTEISGRGVGLDAVKDAVEKIGGKISVKSRKTIGTTFEIFLPK